MLFWEKGVSDKLFDNGAARTSEGMASHEERNAHSRSGGGWLGDEGLVAVLGEPAA